MSNTIPRRYKQYLEPNCGPKQSKIPRTSEYRKNLKRCGKSTNEPQVNATTSTNYGEVFNSDSVEVDEDISILTEAEVSFIFTIIFNTLLHTHTSTKGHSMVTCRDLPRVDF